MNSVSCHAHKLACKECDLLIEMPEKLPSNSSLFCSRCNHKIQSGHSNSLDYVLALSITALCLLMVAISFPFLAFEAKGQGRSIQLLQAAQELYLQGFPLIACMVFAFVVILPMLYLVMLVVLTLPVKLGWRWRMPVWLCKMVQPMLSWAMTEVFIIGVLVALIKVVSMANIVFGLSFWAYLVFTICFIYVSNIVDSHRLWQWSDPEYKVNHD